MDFTIKVKRTKPLGVKFSLRIMKINKLSSQYEGKELFVRFINEGTGKGKKSTTHDTSLQPVEEGLAFWPPKATQPYEFKALIELDEKEGLQPYPLLFCTLLKGAGPYVAPTGKKKDKGPDTKDMIGIMVKLDLTSFAKDGTNTTEVFAVPKSKGDDTIAYAIQFSIKATWMSYNNRPIDHDEGQEGEPLTLLGQRYLYVESRDDDIEEAIAAPPPPSPAEEEERRRRKEEARLAKEREEEAARQQKKQQKEAAKAASASKEAAAAAGSSPAAENSSRRRPQSMSFTSQEASQASGPPSSSSLSSSSSSSSASLASSTGSSSGRSGRRHSVSISSGDLAQLKASLGPSDDDQASSPLAALIPFNKNKGKATVKVRFEITLLDVTVPSPSKASGNYVFIAWRRGNKSENEGKTGVATLANDSATLPSSSFSLNCTFKRDQATQQLSEKNLALSLKYTKSKDGKGTVLGKAVLDLAKYANGEQIVPVSFGGSSSSSLSSSSAGGTMMARVQIRPQWEVTDGADGGKKIIPFDPATLQGGASPSSRSSKRLSNKNQLRVRFAIRPLRVGPLDPAMEGTAMMIEFSTGSSAKKLAKSGDGNSRSAVAYCEHGEAQWPASTDAVVGSCHIKLDAKNNELAERKGKVIVYSRGAKAGSKESKIAEIPFNLSEFAASQQTATRTSFAIPKSKSAAQLDLEIVAKWEKYEGKVIRSAPSSASGFLGGDASQLQLQTSEDMSEISEADGDSDDEGEAFVSDREGPGSASVSPVQSRNNHHSSSSSSSSSAPLSPKMAAIRDGPLPSAAELAPEFTNQVESELRAEIAELRRDRQQQEQQITSLTATIDAQQRELAMLRDQAFELKQLRAQLAEGASSQDQKSNLLREQLLASERTVADLQESVASLKQDKQSFEARAQEQETRAFGLEQQLHGAAQRIAQQEQQIRSLREDLARAGAAGGKKGKDDDSAKLRTQLERLAAENAQLRRGVVGGVQEHAFDAQRLAELEELQQIIYLAELHQYNKHRTPLLAFNLHHMLTTRNAIPLSNTLLLNSVLDGISACCKISGRDVANIVYWLSSTSHLLFMIQRQFQGQGTIGNVTEQGVQLDEARPDTDNVARSFEIFLNQTLRGIYVTFTKALDEDLRRVVEPAIFHQDSAFLTHNQPVPFKMGHITVEDVVELLSTTLELLRKANVFDAVVAQCFHHGIYFISAYLFNELLERKDLCRPQIAFQIKMSVSVIAGWVGTQGALLETAASYLDIITQAANVITLATNVEVFASGDIIRETFPDLNIAQIRKLLQLYSPDQVAPEGLPREVLQTISQTCNEAGNWRELPLQMPRSYEEYIKAKATGTTVARR